MSHIEKTGELAEIRTATEHLRSERAATTPEQRAEKERLFKLENAEAFASMNAWVDEHGLPLARYRQF